ncbi:iron ABC transporter permease [Deltaproteobacteria bacterium PRO3]|nr:iron ABC transporter permease [Deltaproteobacteria bacterium PRO3]
MNAAPLNFRRFAVVLSGLVLLLAAAVALSLAFGGGRLDLAAAWGDTASPEHDILFYSRLPRVLLGLIVGFALSSGGVAFQSLLRNPMADPYILGVSGGAALGSVVAVSLGLAFTWVSSVAFVSALASLLLIYWIAQTKGRLPVYTLLLTGVIFNAFSFALIMFINSLVSFEQAHRIWYLMVGSLEAESYGKIAVTGGFVLAGFLLLFLHAGKMNLMALGDSSAQYLGLDVEKFRRHIFFAASLMIGATVSLSGLIGFVGLFIPHMVRLRLGSDHRLLLPASALFGAAFLVLADLAARTVLSGSDYQTQIPVGVLTALIGGPFFVYLVKKPSSRGAW